MDYLRMMAGGFIGIGSMILIWQGQTEAGVGLLGAMVGFFIGESNGKKVTQ